MDTPTESHRHESRESRESCEPTIRATPVKKRIQILSPIVAERIAAGEVIERPSSVVKELVENSLDAGATEILVLLEDGGKSLIEVLDNGHGMEPDELLLCVKRHATSKLSALEDLEKLNTLGFRGEALPSISAVAELSILSRIADAESAYELVLHSLDAQSPPRPVTFGHFLNSPHGTRMQVRGLFSQIPARLKFLKSQGAEVSQVREWMERLALAHPHAGFRLISDRRPILTLKAQEETARVRTLLSDGEDYPVVSGSNDLGFRERDPGALHIRGHWLQGLSSPNSRRVIQVVNGRAVKDKLLQQAILAPFRQMLLPGQYPAFALFVEIDPAVIDVNVHPTKTEMRFLDSRGIFHAVESMIQSMVKSHGAPAVAASPWRAAEPSGFFTERSPVSPAGGWTAAPSMAMPATQPLLSEFQRAETVAGGTAARFEVQNPAPEPAPASPSGFPSLQPGQWVGVFFNTYLTYDLGQELVMIDQHAAHERIRYEKLRKRVLSGGQIALTTQALLIPEAVRFPEEARARIQDRVKWLELLGFEAEVFGEETLLFRSVPSEWGMDELRLRLKNLVTRLSELDLPQAPDAAELPRLPELLVDESLFEALASQACHSAIRAGDRLLKEEAFQLVDDLFSCEHPWNCPHGRPTVARIPRARLEEWFQRRV